MHTTTLFLAVLSTVRVLAAPVASHGGVFTITGTRTIVPRATSTLPSDTVDQDYSATVGDVSTTASTRTFPWFPGHIIPTMYVDTAPEASPRATHSIAPVAGATQSPGGFMQGSKSYNGIMVLPTTMTWTPVPSPTTTPEDDKTHVFGGPDVNDEDVEYHVAE